MSEHNEANTEDLLYPDPVVELYMKDVDRSLIRSQLRKTFTERLQDLIAMSEYSEQLKSAGKKLRRES